MDFKFVASESVKGIRRNVHMAAALMVCVAVSLTLVGVSWLLSVQVDQLKGYWYDKVEVSVFLCGDTSEAALCPDGPVTDMQRDTVQTTLEELPVVDVVYYESQFEAWERFSEQYKDSSVLSAVDVSTMPESFRVKLHDPEKFSAVADAVAATDGVESVQDQRKLLAGFFSLVSGLQTGALVVALSQIMIAVLVVGATVRLAVHSRRKEVEVMRLVGASRAMVRAPFFGEAAVAGVVGSMVALCLLAALQHWVVEAVLASRGSGVTYVSWTDYATLAPFLVVGGLVVPGAAAAWALRKHLRV